MKEMGGKKFKDEKHSIKVWEFGMDIAIEEIVKKILEDGNWTGSD